MRGIQLLHLPERLFRIGIAIRMMLRREHPKGGANLREGGATIEAQGIVVVRRHAVDAPASSREAGVISKLENGHSVLLLIFMIMIDSGASNVIDHPRCTLAC